MPDYIKACLCMKRQEECDCIDEKKIDKEFANYMEVGETHTFADCPICSTGKLTDCPKYRSMSEECRVEDKAKAMNERIGMLRQWLNEDRITDPKKMITNDDIKYWLEL